MEAHLVSEDLLPEIPHKQKKGLDRGSIGVLMTVVIIAIIVGLGFSRQLQTQPTSGPAPDFTITTFEGEEFTLLEQRGKVVVINFWASWCPPCRDEAPILQDFWERYRDQGVILVGITYADTESASLAYIEEFGITFPNGPDQGTRISDNDYHITGVPETFIVDQIGNIQAFWAAPIQPGQLEEVVDRLLQSPPEAGSQPDE